MKITDSLFLLLLVFNFDLIYAQQTPTCGTWNPVLYSFLTPCNECEYGAWELVFDDEFDGPINTNKWYTCIDGWKRWHGDELQYYLNENIIVENGILNLQARHEPGDYPYIIFENGVAYHTQEHFEYTSGMLQTKTQFKYGLFEIKCRIPSGQGFWPAFWFFGNEGEIDVFEFNGSEPDTHHITIHSWPMDGEHQYCPSSWINNSSFSDDFHVFSLEWDEYRLVFRVDGIVKRIDYKYMDTNTHFVEDCSHHSMQAYFQNSLFPEHAQSLFINLAISSNNSSTYGQAPNAQTPFPSSLEVDYVRVYKRNNPNTDTSICSFNDKESDYFTGRTISTIETDSCLNISEGEAKVFIACQSVVLQSGFAVEEGGCFSATIGEETRCQPLLIPNTEKANVDIKKESAVLRKNIGKNNNIFDGLNTNTLTKTSSENSLVNCRLFDFFPNPNVGNFQIKLNLALEQYECLQVIDCMGNILYSITRPTTQIYNVSLEHKKGFYYIKCSTDTQIEITKLIIQ